MKTLYNDLMALAQAEELNVEIPPRTEIKDLKVFLDQFRSSDLYQKEFSKYFEDKNLSSDVTEADKSRVFEADETARKTLIEFARNSDSELIYHPSEHRDDFKEAIKDYFKLLKDHKKG